MPSSKSISSIARALFGDSKYVPAIVHEGRKIAYKGEGTGSAALWPIMAALKKLKGADKIDTVVYEKYLRRVKNADEKLGRVLAQHGPSQKLFSITETLPTTRRIKGMPTNIEHQTYSALAPATKVSKAAAPMLAGLYASQLLSKHEKSAGAKMDAKQLMKQAADAIEEHRRREDSIKLAMLMVEKGKCDPFSSMDELEEKVASFSDKNLDVVKEALEMDSELTDFGKVASQSEVIKGLGKAETNFFHRLSE